MQWQIVYARCGMSVISFPPRPVRSLSAGDAWRAKQMAANAAFLAWLQAGASTAEVDDAVETVTTVLRQLQQLQSFLMENV